MGKVCVAGFTVSLDGFAAGPGQTLDDPLGRGGMALHRWLFEGDDTDQRFAKRILDGAGAHIMGRNMFGPVRGDWGASDWRGWWGEEPPYHTPVFVLTHHAHPSIGMRGGTTFYFVTGGIAEALERAQDAAGDRDVHIAGGASTVRQYLQAGLVDEMHLAFAPVLLGQGEALLPGIDLMALGFVIAEQVATPLARHVVLVRA